MSFTKTNEEPFSVIKGTVTTSDGKPAQHVSVIIKNNKKGTVTDENGAFTLKKIKPGTYTLQVTLVGFETLEQTVTVVADQTAELSFQLKANDEQLKEVVVSMGRNKFSEKDIESVARMPLKNLENPQVYSVVTNEIMKEQIVTDYKDAIRNAAGVNSTETVSNGRTSTIIRGFRTANFVRNGMVTNILSTIEPAGLERIEVMKGPTGTLFGSGATSYGGLVNRVTKKPFEEAATEVGVTVGSFGLKRLTADINTPLNKDKTVLLRVNMARHSTESFQENGFHRNYFLASALSYKASEKLSFLFDLELMRNFGTAASAYISPDPAKIPSQKSFKDMKEFYFKTYSSDDITSTFPSYNFYGQMNYKLSKNWTSSTLYSYGAMDAKNQLQFTPSFVTDSTLRRQIQKYNHHYYTIQFQENINGEFYLGNIRNRVLIGGDYVTDVTKPTYIVNFFYDTINFKKPSAALITTERINQRLSQIATPNSYFQSRTDRYGLYASDVIDFTSRLHVMLSLRWDKVDAKGTLNLLTGKTTGTYTKSSYSPKLGFTYEVLKNRLSVFGNYMNGFVYSATADSLGNIFKPEQANQLEGGAKLDMLGGKLVASVSYYDIKVKDKLRSVPNSLFSIQDGSQYSKGLELELIANPGRGLNIMGGYAHNESKITKATANEGKRPARSGGKDMANVWASYRISKTKLQGLGFGAGAYYNSETTFNDQNNLYFPSYTLINGTIFYDQPKYRIGVKLDNIGNVRYWGPWGEPQPPRNYAVNVIFKI